MKKGLLCLLLACAFLFSFAGRPLPVGQLRNYQFILPIHYTETKKAVSFYLPNTCNGFLSEYLEGKGTLSISAEGAIRNGKVSVRVKIAYRGEARSSLGYANYNINASTSLYISQFLTETADVFVQDRFRMQPDQQGQSVFLGNLGYITVYPDGSLTPHILTNELGNASANGPAIYCRSGVGE